MRWLAWIRGKIGRFAPGAGAVLPWVGGALMVLAAALAGRSWNAGRTQERALAMVTENVAAFAPGGGLVYRPKLRFVAGGAMVQVVVGRGSEEVEFAAGETVPVRYHAGDPQGAVIATVGRVYFWAILLGVLGIVILDAGLIARRIAGGKTV